MDKDKLNKDMNKMFQNKKFVNCLIVLLVIIFLWLAVSNFLGNDSNVSDKNNAPKGAQEVSTNDGGMTSKELLSYEEDQKKQLEDILSKIEGVGSVKVFINYSESSETVAMYNENSKTSTTEETDKSGGTRKVEQTDSQKEVIYQEQNGTKTPIVQKTVEPKIEGAIITAKGAGDINVKTSIIQAVEAATGLATHKIQVFTMSV